MAAGRRHRIDEPEAYVRQILCRQQIGRRRLKWRRREPRVTETPESPPVSTPRVRRRTPPCPAHGPVPAHRPRADRAGAALLRGPAGGRRGAAARHLRRHRTVHRPPLAGPASSGRPRSHARSRRARHTGSRRGRPGRGGADTRGGWLGRGWTSPVQTRHRPGGFSWCSVVVEVQVVNVADADDLTTAEQLLEEPPTWQLRGATTLTTPPIRPVTGTRPTRRSRIPDREAAVCPSGRRGRLDGGDGDSGGSRCGLCSDADRARAIRGQDLFVEFVRIGAEPAVKIVDPALGPPSELVL
jgi:hypothetical protein